MVKSIKMSLARKFILYLSALLVVVLGSVTAVNVYFQRQALVNQEVESFRRLEDSIIILISDSMAKGEQEEIQRKFDRYDIKSTGVQAIQLLDHDGFIKRSTDPGRIGKLFIDDEIARALNGEAVSEVEIEKDTGRRVFHHLQPVLNREACHSCHGSERKILGVINFISDWQPLQKMIEHTQARNIMLSVFGILCVGSLIFFLTIGMIIRPLRQVVEATRKVSAGDLSWQIKVNSKDEMGQLESAFNKMVQQLNSSSEEVHQQNEEIATANEELQAANEELIASNETLLKTTEELEEKKMQLQALAANLEQRVLERTGEIRALQNWLVEITNGIDEGIMLISKDFKILWANRKVMESSGLKESEIIGRPCYKVTHKNDEPCSSEYEMCPIDQLKKTNAPVCLVHTHFDKQNNAYYVEVSIYPLKDESGQVHQYIHVTKDITERVRMTEEMKRYIANLETVNRELRQTQARLIQSAKMASLGQLASGIAHEINNPLTGVLNNVQLIKMGMDSAGASFMSEMEFKELLDVIEESALRCTRITSSLLEFSRASSASTQPVSANELVEKILILIGHELVLQNIVVETELYPQLPLVLINPQLLQQVLMNLVTNARWAIKKKSPDAKGAVTIKTEHNPMDERVNIYVSDTGIGMPQEVLDRLFEPFFTTKEVGEGTGLGLSVVYGIIKDHKGNIEVQSKPGEGATFKISLPVYRGEDGK